MNSPIRPRGSASECGGEAWARQPSLVTKLRVLLLFLALFLFVLLAGLVRSLG
ncbi:hypothetical protein [Halorubrum trapanicum]|uniref:hypothetical protein n=1 Tax=Halorubrum trapanicum TaxID=29284 RepID=UPI0012FD83E2|nr:hypothetical protein [Halorubrum trapanicum]